MKNLKLLTMAMLVVIIGIGLQPQYNAYAGNADAELFSPVPRDVGPKARREREPTILRSRDVQVNFNLLASKDAPEGAEYIILNMFDDVNLIAVRDRLERRSATSYTWFGTILELDRSQVILVVEDGSMAGNVVVDGQMYQVRDAGRGIHSVRNIDQSAFPDEAPPTVVSKPTQSTSALSVSKTYLSADMGQEFDDDGSFIDVMVVYTADVAAASAGIDAEIQLAVDETNQSYLNSGIYQRLRLAHSEQIDYEETGDIELDRNRLQNPSDGYMDNVHTLRDTHCADLVCLLVEDGGPWCGIAYIMTDVSVLFEDHGFCVVDRGCATGYYSFGHELGHIMSARHDWYVDSTNNSPFTYNHAFVYLPDRWRTIMAYDTECDDNGFNCTRLQYWSNPDVDYFGVAMGVAEGNPDAADNRKTLNMTAYAVSNFREHCNHPPEADAGPDQIVECECSSGGTLVTLDGTGSSDPDGDPLTYTWTGPFAESPASGATPTVTLLDGCEGDYVITLVVNDGTVDSELDDVTITVVDTVAPVITCPPDVTLECPADTNPDNTGFATAVDDCDDSPIIDYSDTSIPTCGNTEVIIREWIATDRSGNSSCSCTQIIIVEDTTPPEVTVGEMAPLWPPNHKYHQFKLSDFVLSVEDICAGTLDVDVVGTIISIHSDEPEDAKRGVLQGGDGSTLDDMIILNNSSFEVRSERIMWGNGRVYTITFEVVDPSGNAAVGMCSVGVPSNIRSFPIDGPGPGYTIP